MADNSRSFPGTPVLDGADYVKKVDPAGIDLTGSWTFGLWLNNQKARQDACIVKFGNDDDGNLDRGVMMKFDDDGVGSPIEVRLAGLQVALGSTELAVDSWHTAGGTYDSSTGSDNLQVHLDGVQEGQHDADTPNALTAGDMVALGRSQDGSDPAQFKAAWFFYLQGVVLTAAEIDSYLNDPQSLVTDFGPSGAVTANALKELWPFQCSGGTTETDKSGVGNDGTYTGTVTLGSGDGPSPTTDWSTVCGGGASNVTVNPSGFGLSASLGTPTVLRSGVQISPTGFQLTVTRGTPTLTETGVLQPAGLPVTVSLGTPTPTTNANVSITPTGFSVATALGTFTTETDITIAVASGLGLSAAVGAPAVNIAAGVLIVPAGFPLTASRGTPSISSNINLSPNGFGLAASVGTPLEVISGTTLTPVGFPVQALVKSALAALVITNAGSASRNRWWGAPFRWFRWHN